VKCRIRNLVAAVSLSLLIIAAIFWLRSYWINDGLYYSNAKAEGTLWSNRGQLTISVSKYSWYGVFPDLPPAWFWIHRPAVAATAISSNPLLRDTGEMWNLHVLGFSSSATHGSDISAQTGPNSTMATSYAPSFTLSLPYAEVVLVLVAIAAAMLRGAIAKNRHLPGICTFCDYDMRATPERCPECGVWRPLSKI
jgi:hypothetical protein